MGQKPLLITSPQTQSSSYSRRKQAKLERRVLRRQQRLDRAIAKSERHAQRRGGGGGGEKDLREVRKEEQKLDVAQRRLGGRGV